MMQGEGIEDDHLCLIPFGEGGSVDVFVVGNHFPKNPLRLVVSII